jgi:predicted CopG family antitoxin
MSTKTISVSLPAYERLCRARSKPEESFSQVILRAEWRGQTITADRLLEDLTSVSATYTAHEIEQVEEARRVAEPPVDKWPNS